MAFISKIKLSLLCLGTIISMVAHDTEHIHYVTHLILKRFYFIRRLEKSITSLHSQAPHSNKDMLQKLILQIEHDYVRAQLRLIITKGTIQPLYAIWKHLCSYRSLEDDLLVQEFTRIVYTISQGTFVNTQKNQTIFAYEDIANITQRFYLIHRLEYAVEHYCLKKDLADPALFILKKMWDDALCYKHIEREDFSFHLCSLIIDSLAPEKSPLLSQEAPRESIFTIIDEITDQRDYEYAEQQKMSYFQQLCAFMHFC